MAVVKKISELTPKGSALGNTDLLVVGVDNGSDYDLKSVTGAQLLGNVVSQTITDGVTTTAPSENVVFDALALKVDKVAGSRLITSAESTILGNTSGTNTGDQNLQEVTNINATTSNSISIQSATFQSALTPSQIQTQRLSNSKRSSLNADGFISFSTTGTSEATIKATNILNDVTLEVPNKSIGSYTIATTTDLTSKVDSNTAITGATKIKITYDSKGLITSGADATTSDIADSLNKRYVTDANLTTIGNTSGTNTGNQTFLDARVQSISSSATVTPTSANDLVIITAQGVGLTLANPTGTFTEGQALMIRIKDNATARAITFDTNYRAIGVTLPTTTVISKTLYLGIIYNSTDSKWDVIGLNQQA